MEYQTSAILKPVILGQALNYDKKNKPVLLLVI